MVALISCGGARGPIHESWHSLHTSVRRVASQALTSTWTPRHRILWGGLASAFPLPRAAAEAKLRAEMLQAYPELKDVKTEYIWCGAMGWSVSEMPLIGRTSDGIWYATGVKLATGRSVAY